MVNFPTRAPSRTPTIYATNAPTSSLIKHTCLSWSESPYLHVGDYILSPDATKAAMLTKSGDLCIYSTYGTYDTSLWYQRWCLGASSTQPDYVYIDYGGNMRIVAKSGYDYWHSATGAGYSGYLELSNSGLLYLHDSWNGLNSWSCSSTLYYGYDYWSNIVYMSAACPYDSTASYDYHTCTTASISAPTQLPTIYPTYNYGYSSSSSSGSIAAYIVPVVIFVLALISGIVRQRQRTQQGVPISPGYDTTTNHYHDQGKTYPSAPPFSTTSVGYQQAGPPAVAYSSQPIGYPASINQIPPAYAGTGMYMTNPSPYQPVPQSMSNPSTYGPVTGGAGGSISSYGYTNTSPVIPATTAPTYVQPFQVEPHSYSANSMGGYEYKAVPKQAFL